MPQLVNFDPEHSGARAGVEGLGAAARGRVTLWGTIARTLSFSALTLAMVIVGCAYPNQFRDVDASSPHAVLVGEGVKLTNINGQPTSFWDSRGRFHVSPGTNAVRAAYSDRHITFGYREIEFVAADGCEYLVAPDHNPLAPEPISARPHPSNPSGWVVQDCRDLVAIRQRTENGLGKAVAVAPRENFIFDRGTCEAAIAEYHRQNEGCRK